MLVDSHCHLDFSQFDGELDAIIHAAREAGVGRMVSICTRLGDLAQVRAIAERHREVFFAAGVHPLNVGEADLPGVEDLAKVAAHPKMIGIGETGLDYHYDRWPRDISIASLRTHIEAARHLDLPLIIHARDADEDIEAVLREAHAEGPFRCVMHCFSSGRKLAEAAIELGFYLSMSGVVTFKNSSELRDIFSDQPLERILVETDAPYLAPVPRRGKRNEPAYTAFTAQKGAEIMGVGAEEFAATTTANFYRLFSKAARYDGIEGAQ